MTGDGVEEELDDVVDPEELVDKDEIDEDDEMVLEGDDLAEA